VDSKPGYHIFPLVTEEFLKSDTEPNGWKKKPTWHSIYYKTSRREPFLKSSMAAIEGKIETTKLENGTFFHSIVASSVKVLLSPKSKFYFFILNFIQ
jgi:hypothetical protein